MSVLQKVTGWLSGKGASNPQAAYGSYKSHGYYGSSEAEDAYGSMTADRFASAPEESPGYQQPPQADPYAADDDPYNGRVPYRSRQDRQQDYMYNQQQETRHRRADAQPQGYGQMPPQQSYQQAPRQMPQTRQPGNVVDFPTQQEAAPTHVEYVILLRSRNECTKVIEYIKTNASVFMNMEYIANESERQRCVDMLAGAAYTLGCQLHKISNRGIYLIASPYVRVMIDPAMKRFNATAEARPFMQQQTDEYPPVQEHMAEPQQQMPVYNQQPRETVQPADPYAQLQQQPRQQEYSPFQRPRPTFQTRQQESLRRASGGQYFNRQSAANQPSYQ